MAQFRRIQCKRVVIGTLRATDAGKERREDSMVRKKLPIGIENFEEFSSEDFYYVDKTLFIKELLQNRDKVNLFTRPRRDTMMRWLISFATCLVMP